MPRSWNIIVCCIPAWMSAATVLADEARQVFDSLYGQKIRQVVATADRTDDIALAREMLAVARESGGTPGLQILLCNGAGDLAGRHPDGYAAAIEAMRLLADEREDQRDAARAKLIDLLTRQSRTGKAEERADAGDGLIDLFVTTGDEKAQKRQYAEAAGDYRRANTLAVQRKSDRLETIKTKLEFAMSRDRAVKQIARLQERLLQNATDHATAEEIVKLYVVELDDPKAAAIYLDRTGDARFKRLVTATIREQDATASESLALGQWYKELADAAGAPAKYSTLRHSKHYIERFLSLHSDSDLDRTRATVLLNQVNTELARIAVAARPPEKSPGRPSRELIIQGVVDGHSLLVITPSGMHWVHKSWNKPHSITLNGKPWEIEWLNGGNTSKPFPLRFDVERLKMEKFNEAGFNRGHITTTNQDNAFTISLDDHQGGPGSYKIKLLSDGK